MLWEVNIVHGIVGVGSREVEEMDVYVTHGGS